MRLLASFLLTLTLATFIGLGATWYVTTRSIAFGAVTVGAWQAQPKSGTQDIDPYAHAVIARSGELPLGSGDGLAFLSRTADDGRRLDGRCEIIVAGSTPLARYWTLTAHDGGGRVIANPTGRYGFTSVEVARQADGRFEVVVAPRARAGNWLPSGGIGELQLVLRLYDTPIGMSTRSVGEMPKITMGPCS